MTMYKFRLKPFIAALGFGGIGTLVAFGVLHFYSEWVEMFIFSICFLLTIIFLVYSIDKVKDDEKIV